eukprot:COSAG06_NODE_210_length_20171_cov_14.683489_19_plen_250_part_00
MFVPSLSWQNDTVLHLNGSKRPFWRTERRRRAGYAHGPVLLAGGRHASLKVAEPRARALRVGDDVEGRDDVLVPCARRYVQVGGNGRLGPRAHRRGGGAHADAVAGRAEAVVDEDVCPVDLLHAARHLALGGHPRGLAVGVPRRDDRVRAGDVPVLLGPKHAVGSEQPAGSRRPLATGWLARTGANELRQRSELGSGGPELGAGAFVDGGARERAALGLRAGQEREERNARSGVVHGGHRRVSFAFGHI